MKTFNSISIVIVTILMAFTAPAYSGHIVAPWNHQNNDPGRFVVLSQFSNAAVLDKETGLVWEQSPGTGVFADDLRNWNDARFECAQKIVGNRKGWRLPSFFELSSLILSSSTGGLALPPGHPFSNVHFFWYWTATTDAVDPTVAWVVNTNGNLGPGNKVGRNFVWCVRGGNAGPDVY